MPQRFKKKKRSGDNLDENIQVSKYIILLISCDNLLIIVVCLCHACKLTFVKVHSYSRIGYICWIQKNTFDFSYIFSLFYFLIMLILLADVFTEGGINVSKTSFLFQIVQRYPTIKS